MHNRKFWCVISLWLQRPYKMCISEKLAMSLVSLKSDETFFDTSTVSVTKCCRSCNTIDDPFGPVMFQINFEKYEYKRIYWG